MKASAAMLAGLLAGLALGGVSQAQSIAHPVIIVPESRAKKKPDVNANPLKGISPKAARCVVDCQAPSYQCAKRCGREASDTCIEKCSTQLFSCMEKCGVDTKKLQDPG